MWWLISRRNVRHFGAAASRNLRRFSTALRAVVLSACLAWFALTSFDTRVLTVVYPAVMSVLAAVTPTTTSSNNGGGGFGGKYWTAYWLVFSALKLVELWLRAVVGAVDVAADAAAAMLEPDDDNTPYPPHPPTISPYPTLDPGVVSRFRLLRTGILAWCLFCGGSSVVYERILIPGLARICTADVVVEAFKSWARVCGGVVGVVWTGGVRMPVEIGVLAYRRWKGLLVVAVPLPTVPAAEHLKIE